MVARFHNVAVFHNKDKIGILDCGKSVCNDKARSAGCQRVHRLLDQYLRSCIDVTFVRKCDIGQAVGLCNMSVATFYRRLREYRVNG